MNRFNKRMMAIAMLLTTGLGSTTIKAQLYELPEWTEDWTKRIEIHGYAQAGWSYEDFEGAKPNSTNLKRTLVWAKAQITDRWSFLFMHDFSSVVQEYYADFRVTNDKSLNVRFGQFKHSYSMENPLSPTQLELIDIYSQAVLYLAGEGPDPLNGVNYGRDQGLMVFGDILQDKVHYELALMSGQGINRRDANSQKDVIAHLEYKPIKGLRFVATGQLGTGNAVGTAAWNPTINIGDNYRRDRYSFGAEWKSERLGLRAEWLGGRDGDVGSRGGYLTACVPVYKGLDIIASGEFFDRNTDMDYDQTNATAGIQYWFHKKCRLQLQYTRAWRQFADDYNWIQTQIQVGF